MGGEGGDGNGGAGSSGGAALETTTYHWNLQRMLEKVILPSGEPVEYRYDGAGRLTGRITADGEDLFVQTGWDIVEKRSVGQSPQGTDWQGQGSQGADLQGTGLQVQDSQGQNREGQRTYYTGLSSIKEGDKVRYYLYNHRGDTVLVTGGDGEIIHNLSYEAYGKATDKLGYPAGSVNIETSGGSDAWGGGSGSGWGASRGATSGGGAGGGGSESFGGGDGATSGGANSSAGSSSGGRGSGSFPALFVGGAGISYDVKTNLHYMRFRWFSPDQMRFITKDLLMDENRYAYVSNNPINKIDKFGLQEEDFLFFVFPADTNFHAAAWYRISEIMGTKCINELQTNENREKYSLITNYHVYMGDPADGTFPESQQLPILFFGALANAKKLPQKIYIFAHGNPEGLYGERNHGMGTINVKLIRKIEKAIILQKMLLFRGSFLYTNAWNNQYNLLMSDPNVAAGVEAVNNINRLRKRRLSFTLEINACATGATHKPINIAQALANLLNAKVYAHKPNDDDHHSGMHFSTNTTWLWTQGILEPNAIGPAIYMKLEKPETGSMYWFFPKGR